MSRRKRNRRQGEEINLTPLLDVLFTILFVVMLTGMQSEQTMQAESAVTAEHVAELEKENQRLREELRTKNAVEFTEDSFYSKAVLVTLVNTIEDDAHTLNIYIGPEGILRESFKMGPDRSQYISDHLSSIINGILEEADGYPVYIVFHCSAAEIYRREEFAPIQEQLEVLRTENKEIFYQIIEE